MSSQTRFSVGQTVHARACRVRSIPECKRRYGSRYRSHLLTGVVVAVEAVVGEGNRRATTIVTAKFNLGDNSDETRTVSLNSRSIVVEAPNTVNHNSSPCEPTAPINTDKDAASSVTNDPNKDVLVVPNCHGTPWYKNESVVTAPLGPPVHYRTWRATDEAGGTASPMSDVASTRQIVDYFHMMFPPEQLFRMVRLTNCQLTKFEKEPMDVSELLKFFGVILLTTQFEFGARRDLWAVSSNRKYVPAPAFGNTGMSRQRFDDLWRLSRFSYQPDHRPDDMPGLPS